MTALAPSRKRTTTRWADWQVQAALEMAQNGFVEDIAAKVGRSVCATEFFLQARGYATRRGRDGRGRKVMTGPTPIRTDDEAHVRAVLAQGGFKSGVIPEKPEGGFRPIRRYG